MIFQISELRIRGAIALGLIFVSTPLLAADPLEIPALPATSKALSTSIDPFQGARLAESRGDNAEALTSYIRVIATDPRNIRALIGAGRAALRLGDTEAALGFLARADELDPRSAQTKAGLAAALTMMDRPRDAMPLFDEALRLGIRESDIAGDRGLAYDLMGDPIRAQKEYALALKNAPDSEVMRRLAISQGAAGKMALALDTLDPLLRKQDRAAWRDRAFIIAMNGDTRAAQQSAALILPPSQVNVLTPYLGRMASLSPTERMRAVHFGVFPDTGASASPETIAMIEEDGSRGMVPTGAPLGKANAASTAEAAKEQTRRELDAAIAARAKAQAEAATRAKAQAEAAARAKAQAEARAAAEAKAYAEQLAADAATRKAEQEKWAREAREASARTEAERLRQQQAEMSAATTTRQPTALPATSLGATIAAQQSGAALGPGADGSPVSRPTTIPAPTPVPAIAPHAPPAAGESGTGLQIVLPEVRPEDEKPVTPSPAVAALMTDTPPTSMAPPTPSKPQKEPATLPVKQPPQGKTSLEKPGSASPAMKALTDKKAKLDCAPDPKAKKGAKPKPGCEEKLATAKDAAKLTCKPDPKARKGSKATQVCEEPKPVCKPDPKTKKGSKAQICEDAKTIKDAKAEDNATGKDKNAAERYWAQVASGPNKPDLVKSFNALKAKAPALFSGKTAWSTPWRASNRLLVGPFPTEEAAQSYVNQLAGKGIAAIQFTSRAGVAVERLAGK